MDVFEALDRSAGPQDFNGIDTIFRTQTEMDSPVARRHETHAGRCMVVKVPTRGGGQGDFCSNAIVIAFVTAQIEWIQ